MTFMDIAASTCSITKKKKKNWPESCLSWLVMAGRKDDGGEEGGRRWWRGKNIYYMKYGFGIVGEGYFS